MTVAVTIFKEELTMEQFRSALPPRHKARLKQETVDHINQLLTDPQLRENFRENLVSFTSILTEGKFSIRQYINAVKFVSLKVTGCGVLEAYSKTFPDRYKELIDRGTSPKDLSAYSAAFNKSALVNKILEQTLVPIHILNADVLQEAINTQAYLMIHANSEKVRTDAANSLMTHLKRPESNKFELNINTKEDKSIDELRKSTMELVAQQKLMITSGALNAENIAQKDLVVIEAGE